MIRNLGDAPGWITTDGFIWCQIQNQETAIDIFIRNAFELYMVDLITEVETLIDNEDDLNECFSPNFPCETIVAIEVGKLEKVGNLFRILK